MDRERTAFELQISQDRRTVSVSHVHREDAFPLDYSTTDYSYIERPNAALIALVERLVLASHASPRILDVGCGAGANARALRERAPEIEIHGIEPNARAAELARESCDEVFQEAVESWLGRATEARFDAVILSDVIEHVVDPVGFLRRLAGCAALGDATFVISVPNYAVWYNRARTLLGRFEYSWSGLYDRTHLRFFTRRSLLRMLEHCGFELIDQGCTPSLVQSAAPLLRRAFEKDVGVGNHLALSESRAFAFYRRWFEPAESRLCALWPELLAFQVVVAARPRPGT